MNYTNDFSLWEITSCTATVSTPVKTPEEKIMEYVWHANKKDAIHNTKKILWRFEWDIEHRTKEKYKKIIENLISFIILEHLIALAIYLLIK